MAADTSHAKRALRAELRERRRNHTSVERIRATEGLTAGLVALVQRVGARSVACYLSAVDEPDTRPFINWARAAGIRVLFPISRDDGLLDWTAATPEE